MNEVMQFATSNPWAFAVCFVAVMGVIVVFLKLAHG